MTHVAVIGEYGIRSLGDEAMLHVLARGLVERFGDVTLTAIGRLAILLQNGETYEAHSTRAGESLFESERMVHAALGDDARHLRRFFEDGMPAGQGRIWEVIEDADLVLIGGGNLFVDLNADFAVGPMTFFSFVAMAAHAVGTPVALISSSIGPLRTNWGRKLAARVLSLCSKVMVRDQRSLALARELGTEAELLPDLAVGIEPMHTTALDGDYVAVSPKWFDGAETGLVHMARTLEAIHERTGLRPLLIPHCRFDRLPEDDDLQVCQAMFPRIKTPGAGILDGAGANVPEVVLDIYGQCRAALAVRLHGAIFAAVAGTPFLALNYWPKVRGFCEQVDAPCAELDAPDRWLPMFLEVWERRDAERERLHARVEEMRAQLPRYWDIVEELVCRG